MRWVLDVIAVALVGYVGACAPPMELSRGAVLREVAARYRRFYPAAGDPDPARDAGLLAPRFGAPAIVAEGGAFTVEVMERGGPVAVRARLARSDLADADLARCLDGAAVPGCWALDLAEVAREPVAGGAQAVTLAARAREAVPPGGFDLALASSVDAPARAPRAVWIEAVDPAAPRPLHVVQLSDLHVGARRHDAPARLARVLAEVNALAPDLVIVTGDLVEDGEDRTEVERAQAMLRTVGAPVLAVMGGHDVGTSFSARVHRSYGRGWENHARAFGPTLLQSTTLGGWDFVGFDTGPTTGAAVLDRGVAPSTVDALRGALDEARRDGRRGVVLFSHAPSRSSSWNRDRGLGRGWFGRMRWGGPAVEAAMLEAAGGGQRVLHLAGHTHWSDVFVAEPARDGRLRFARAPLAPSTRAALITTQSTTKSGYPLKHGARGFGYAELFLDEDLRLLRHQYP